MAAVLLFLEACAWAASGLRVPCPHATIAPARLVAQGVRMVAPPMEPLQYGGFPDYLPKFMSAQPSKVATLPWEVHKFGGASLATAELYIQCAELLVEESRRPLADIGSCAPTMAIVSAKGGVTDKLVEVV